MTVDTISTMRGPGTIWRFPWLTLLLLASAGVLSIWLFWDGLYRMWGWWLDVPEYSHGILIPPVSAFLIWQQKDRLERLDFDGSWWGAALVVLGGLLLFLGQLAAIYTLIEYAYLVTLTGLVLALVGRRVFRLLAFPLLVLVFMVPLPQFILQNLSAKLQLLSSHLGVWFIRLFDISVFVAGNVIDLGGYKLQVAEACDGLRYLFPLMTLGFLMAYFYKGAAWKRGVLFLSSIPITVVMNSFRIGTIGVMVEHWGIAMAEGFLHEFQGWAVFMVSAAVMLAEIALLNRIGREQGSWRQLFGIEMPAHTPRDARISNRSLPASFVGAFVVLAVLAALSAWMPRPAEIYPARAGFDQFPSAIGAWSGQRESMESIYLDALKLDDYFLGNFHDGSGVPINLYVAYYNSQRKGEAVHSPRSCLPGGGWQLREFNQRTLTGVQINGRPLRVNRTLIALGGQRQLVYYWFQQRGRAITNEFAVKWFLFQDAVTLHRTDGALVRLVVPIPAGGTEADADRRLTEFASRLTPQLTRYVPN